MVLESRQSLLLRLARALGQRLVGSSGALLVELQAIGNEALESPMNPVERLQDMWRPAASLAFGCHAPASDRQLEDVLETVL
jgi:hypothetical protein